ncbi:alpha/beta-hydrolase [Fistulina hepatica ATCC 64428]|uniref:Alpha/beta-hydrolase n=1 Tax=Fistulina hepatica ATCC 64428 TaxID=1128425 RepID=A0A0D7A2S3_9AGAR|nr:alpha/beta-hydrolase [Fistulina hepatica ATCC 64428]
MIEASYGTWESPVTTDIVVQAVRISRFNELLVDPVTSKIYHIESRPEEGGRCALVDTVVGADVLTKEWSINTAVHEYGGSCSIIRRGVLYFSNQADRCVYRYNLNDAGSALQLVTPKSDVHRYADFDIHPTLDHLLVSVLEDHTIDVPAKVKNSLCIIDTQKCTVSLLIEGADFYANPRFSADGTSLVWQQWYHPDMPWHGAEIHVGRVKVGSNGSVSVLRDTLIAGEHGKVGATYPEWTADGILFTCDKSGFQNPWFYSTTSAVARPVLMTPEPREFGGLVPAWLLGFRLYAILEDGKRVVFATALDGRSVLTLFHLDTGEWQELASPYTEVESLLLVPSLGNDSEVIFIGSLPDEGDAIVRLTISPSSDHRFESLKVTPTSLPKGLVPSSVISLPRPMTLPTPNGQSIYAVFYPPVNPEFTGLPGTKPPCIVCAHGGPTSIALQKLSWTKQFFTSRGFAWLDVNYGGSSGYGRAYIERLDGRWGVVDVEDTICAARAISSAPYNLIDPQRLIVHGQSSGGYVVLAALTIASDTSVFAAATSLYGISNLCNFDTHKFESRYADKLLGGPMERVPDVYKARSPLFSTDRITTPLLLLQGDIDRVVPKEQSEAIFNSIVRRGGVVEYKLYEGEGHGFRQAANIKDSFDRELAFYKRVLKL